MFCAGAWFPKDECGQKVALFICTGTRL